MKKRENWTRITQQLKVDIGMVTKRALHADTAVDYAYANRKERPQDRRNMLHDAHMDRPASGIPGT